MRIRKAKIADIEELSGLWMQSMRYHYRLDKYWGLRPDAKKMYKGYAKSLIHSKNAQISVAVDDRGQMVGYMLGKVKKRPPVFKMIEIGWIESAFVKKSERGKGIGRGLYGSLVEWFKSKGIHHIELDVDAKNELGRKVWRKLKFEKYLIIKRQKIKK